ncbi:enoyl-CoA hydratase-related protein [Yoonia sp. 2307UL14-13]|uniref:enoyl-CoA hydratase-related protein n=1 Tax=Yoonia sp. 2307UL14-13 TaxID=3126506 RepID=UPI00309E1FE9
MTDDVIVYQAENGIATVTLNRPDQRNAINPEVCDAMRTAFDRAEADDDIHVVILAGAGAMFCAGMDLKAFAGGQGDKILFGQYGFGGFVNRPRTKPVIAAVEGAAFAGGFEMVLTCDLAIAGESAQFALPEPTIGLVAGAGGAIRLSRYIPRLRANEILLTGAPFGTAEAVDWGLLNKSVPDGQALTAAQSLAAQIARNAPLATRATMALTNLVTAEDEARLWPQNDHMIKELGKSADAIEGARAFVEKRAPVWKGA